MTSRIQTDKNIYYAIYEEKKRNNNLVSCEKRLENFRFYA